MSDTHPSSPSDCRIVEQTNIPELVPERLETIDYSIYHQLTVFQHRGHKCNVESLLSSLGAAISNTAVTRGESSQPSTLLETEVVELLISALKTRFPAWFGEPTALAEAEQATSDYRLSGTDIEEEYFNNEANPEMSTVEGDNWTDHKRVIIPVVAILLHHVRKQKHADSESATHSAQQAIKRTIICEQNENGLSREEVQIAVDAAFQQLDKMYL